MKSLSDLPNETLEMIFRHLYEHKNLKVLVKLTLLSPRINDIISSQLLKSIRVTWNRKLAEKETPSRRRCYSCLLLTKLSVVCSSLKKFVERHGDTLKFLYIADSRVAEFNFLLQKSSGSLAHLKLVRNKISKDGDMAVIEFPRLQGFSVEVAAEKNFSLYSIVRAPKLSHCFYRDSERQRCYRSITNMCDFASFVLLQDNLKVLYVRSYVADIFVNYWATMNTERESRRPKLKLSSLSIHFLSDEQYNIRTSSESIPGFRSLLESQRSSMKILRLEEIQVARTDFDFITKFKLDKLLLRYSHIFNTYDVDIRNFMVRDLYLGTRYDELHESPDFFNTFSCDKGGERYRIMTGDYGSDVVRALNNAFPDFTKLEVGTASAIAKVRLTNVKTLILKETKRQMEPDVIDIIKTNPQLTSLTLHEGFSKRKKLKKELKVLLPEATISFENFSSKKEEPLMIKLRNFFRKLM